MAWSSSTSSCKSIDNASSFSCHVFLFYKWSSTLISGSKHFICLQVVKKENREIEEENSGTDIALVKWKKKKQSRKLPITTFNKIVLSVCACTDSFDIVNKFDPLDICKLTFDFFSLLCSFTSHCVRSFISQYRWNKRREMNETKMHCCWPKEKEIEKNNSTLKCIVAWLVLFWVLLRIAVVPWITLNRRNYCCFIESLSKPFR